MHIPLLGIFKYKNNLTYLTMIEITKMTSKGQVVIPLDIRESKGLKEGEKFIVYDLDDSIVLKRVSGIINIKIMSDYEKTLQNILIKSIKRGITSEDVEKEIQNYRKETKING